VYPGRALQLTVSALVSHLMTKTWLLIRLLKLQGRLLLLLMLLLLGPLAVLAFGELDLKTHWSEASLESSHQSPQPEAYASALVQIFGARAYNWRGAFGIHTWIATKRRGAKHYSVYQVVGWNLYRGRSSVSVSRRGPPDFLWYNARPELLVEHHGSGAEELIDQIEAAKNPKSQRIKTKKLRKRRNNLVAGISRLLRPGRYKGRNRRLTRYSVKVILTEYQAPTGTSDCFPCETVRYRPGKPPPVVLLATTCLGHRGD